MTGVEFRKINFVANNKQKSAGGFIWIKKSDYDKR